MSIQFDIPGKFLPQVLNGDVERYGAILKEVGSGQIVGHLKEVGGLTIGFPGANIASQAVQHAQLAHIQQTLNGLKLVATVGAVASVASLGVSIAGFAVVTQKLGLIEGKLDQLAEELSCMRVSIQELGINWDALTAARMDVAAELLSLAIASSDEARCRSLAEDSAKLFSEMKHYYWRLFNRLDPWHQYEIPPEAALDLFSRAGTCALGQLEAEFLLGDFGAFNKTWSGVVSESRRAADFKLKEAYLVRSNNAKRHGSVFQVATITKDLPQQLRTAKEIAIETVARIDSLTFEAQYVKQLGITPIDYVHELKRVREPNIVLLPWSKDLSGHVGHSHRSA